MRKPRIAVYCRVANYDQVALDCQNRAMCGFAEAKGYEVSKVISDIGGGTRMERPGIRRLQELAKAGAVDAVLASSTSRYARGMMNLMDFARDMADKGVEVLAADVGSVTAVLGDWERILNG